MKEITIEDKPSHKDKFILLTYKNKNRIKEEELWKKDRDRIHIILIIRTRKIMDIGRRVLTGLRVLKEISIKTH